MRTHKILRVCIGVGGLPANVEHLQPRSGNVAQRRWNLSGSQSMQEVRIFTISGQYDHNDVFTTIFLIPNHLAQL